jgi:hypothetical protein
MAIRKITEKNEMCKKKTWLALHVIYNNSELNSVTNTVYTPHIWHMFKLPIITGNVMSDYTHDVTSLIVSMQ